MDTTSKRNLLGEEKSPYLLQHKDNPVHWFPWGEAAFNAAKQESKIIFLSVGYSTCHWCHVMERESFEDEGVAELLNRHFISIKVDREERPDVDQIYMQAVLGMIGHGGWPLTVFLTPDLKPFFGGTYYPRQRFMEILSVIQDTWVNDRQRILTSGEQIHDFLANQVTPKKSEELGEPLLRKAYQELKEGFDVDHGGFGDAPKFPRSVALMLLMRLYRRSNKPAALNMVEWTLEKMARGGIYDHLGGGFARYATDKDWQVPHFEKMLYDNALLAATYLEAFQITERPMYAEVARATLDYVLRDMTDPQGGFYSAEDADSEGVEGKFYVWRQSELEELLTPEEFTQFATVYGVTERGNFEGQTNILNLQANYDWEIKAEPLLQKAHEKLFSARELRVHPHKDDKVLTAWNGLMIAAMAKGYQVLGDARYLKAAQAAAAFIRRHLYKQDVLMRRYRAGESLHDGFLSDYSFLIHGLITLYESDSDPKWFDWALTLQAKQDELFWDDKQHGYFFSSATAKDLIIRQKDFDDGALPSGNAMSAYNLFRLADLSGEAKLRQRATEALVAGSERVGSYPSAYAQALVALDYDLDSAKQVVVVGAAKENFTKEARAYLFSAFLPNKVLTIFDAADVPSGSSLPAISRGKPMLDGKPTAYVCVNQACKLPTNDLEKLKQQLKDKKPLTL